MGSGLASHGGLLGLILAIGWFAWNENLSFLALADVVAFSGAYAGGFIRIGIR
ncbi:MAG: prolipoprotein diacylglyceryl transferase [Leptospira sp.]|nr:prolipoprotein diacylglyceryl transferase [Leptospira sp.]